MALNHPLIVDLDGTLLRSDMLVESMLGYSRRGIRDIFHLPFLVLKGKSSLKEHLACQVPLQVDRLPYNQDVLAFLCEEKKHRPIILATATHQIYAEKIAAHIGLFDRVIATGNRENLSARTKRDRLVQEFGEKGFDYLGNSMADIPVWQSAEKAYVADPEPGVLKKTRQHGGAFSACFTCCCGPVWLPWSGISCGFGLKASAPKPSGHLALLLLWLHWSGVCPTLFNAGASHSHISSCLTFDVDLFPENQRLVKLRFPGMDVLSQTGRIAMSALRSREEQI